MGLIMNTFRDSTIPFTQFGGISMSGEYPNFIKSENWLLTYLTESGMGKTTSLPDGNNHPNTWRMPLKAGAISSRNRVNGSGAAYGTRTYGVAILANLYASGGISSAMHSIGMAILSNVSGSGGISSASIGEGRTITANISGSGDITQAIVSLLVQIYASLSGSGEISDADLKAYLNALATLTGSGTISEADLEGLGELIAVLEGSGVIDPLLVATGELGATIKSYSDLTTEGLRDSIWKAAALNYPDPTTMGGKVNMASVGGIDYVTLSEAVRAEMDANSVKLSDISKVTINKVVKDGNLITIYELDGETIWKQFDLSNGGRSEV